MQLNLVKTKGPLYISSGFNDGLQLMIFCFFIDFCSKPVK